MLDEQACATTHRPGTVFSRNRHAPERKALDAKACPKPEPRRFAPTAVAQRHTLREMRLNPMRYATGRWISDRESGRRKTAATASATSHIEWQRAGRESDHDSKKRLTWVAIGLHTSESLCAAKKDALYFWTCSPRHFDPTTAAPSTSQG